jgi:hypothetical protein
MKKRIFLAAIAASMVLTPFWAAAQVKTLTVKVVNFEEKPLTGGFDIRSIYLVDEKGNAVVMSKRQETYGEKSELCMSADISDWFKVKVRDISAPAGALRATAKEVKNGGVVVDYVMVTTLADSARLRFEFMSGKVYAIGIGVGSKMVVQKNGTGSYRLLLEETAKLSPPPSMEQE